MKNLERGPSSPTNPARIESDPLSITMLLESHGDAETEEAEMGEGDTDDVEISEAETSEAETGETLKGETLIFFGCWS